MGIVSLGHASLLMDNILQKHRLELLPITVKYIPTTLGYELETGEKP
jgi:hypothetical protein